MKIVLASGNTGKLRELTFALQSANGALELINQSDLGIDAAEEPFDTFVENALAKARHVCAASGLCAIADDSGLVVPCLDGAPGIHSARYAGEHGNDAANNARLIETLAMQSATNAAAYFYCALVFMRSPFDPAPLIATGEWHGRITPVARGEHGFGYDPHFELAELGRTAAQLTAKEKSALSHRGQAVARLREAFLHHMTPNRPAPAGD